MVALALTFAATLAAAGYVEDTDAWDRLPPEIVRHVENAIVMPAGSSPIQRYDRFYSASWQDERLVVRASFVQRQPEQSEGSKYRLYGPQAFEIEGGGCSVVNLTYDVEADGAPQLNCNGDIAPEPAAVRKVRRTESQVIKLPRR